MFLPRGFDACYRYFPAFLARSNCLKTAKPPRLSNVRGVLLQCNARLSPLRLFYDRVLHAQNNQAHPSLNLHSDKTRVFDQSERAQSTSYIISTHIHSMMKITGRNIFTTTFRCPHDTIIRSKKNNIQAII